MKANFGKIVGSTTKFMKQNSPLLLTVLGIAGIGATAYTAYKSRDRIKEIVEDLEEQRDVEAAYNERVAYLNSVPVSRMTDEELQEVRDLSENPVEPVKVSVVAKDIAGAVALPVALGISSVCCIALSYHIMNTRIGNLAAAVATLGAERAYYEKKFEREYGIEAKDKFYRPVDKKEVETVDEKGKKKVIKGEVRREMPDSMHGKWFDESTEYASDDPEWNSAFIDQKTQRLQDVLFSRGYLTMNQMLDTLGFGKVRYGSDMGWSTADNFNIYRDVVNELQPDGTFLEQVYIKWPTPRYIYDDMDLEVRDALI